MIFRGFLSFLLALILEISVNVDTLNVFVNILLYFVNIRAINHRPIPDYPACAIAVAFCSNSGSFEPVLRATFI